MKIVRFSRGFSLIELSIVVTIGALMMAGGFATWNGQLEKTKAITTKEKLAAVEKALEAYVARTGYLPCPSSRTAALGEAAFGTATDCNDTTIAVNNCVNGICIQNGRTYDHDNDQATAAVPLRVRVGAVPARALSLPFDVVRDGYGQNFTYAVTEKMAVPPAVGTKAPGGAISIVDDAGISVIDPPGTASYLLLSHGADGKGATSFGSGAVVNACDTGANAGKDAQNCNITSSNAVYRTAVYSVSNAANHFDDMLSYAADIAPAQGQAQAPTTIQATGQIVTIWGKNSCPAGWTKIYDGKRLRILGIGYYQDGLSSTTQPPECIHGLDPKYGTPADTANNPGGKNQKYYHGNSFMYNYAGQALIEPLSLDCAVCEKDLTTNGGNQVVITTP